MAPGPSWLAGATATIAEPAPAPLAAGYVRLRLRDPEAPDVGGRPAWHTVVNEGSGILPSPCGHVITAAQGVTIRAVRACLAWL